MSRVLKRPAISVPTAAANRAITSAAKADPGARPLTAKQLKSMIPLRALRGRPKLAKPTQLVQCATASRFWGISSQRVRGGRRGWTKSC